jgi:hypothetical protein
MSNAPISRYPVPKLEDLPEDIRARMLDVREKAGFIPNVFVTLALVRTSSEPFLYDDMNVSTRHAAIWNEA